MNNNLREAFPCAVDRTRDVTGALAPSPISKGQKFAEQLAYEDTLRPTDAAVYTKNVPYTDAAETRDSIK